MVYTCGDDGILRVYDMRIVEGSTEMFHRDEISFSSPTLREFLCADINADDTMFSIGTNKNVDDAQVYIFDVRFNTKHLYQLCESHSMNITQVRSILDLSEWFYSLSAMFCLTTKRDSPYKTHVTQT